jgi:hypothetical protein
VYSTELSKLPRAFMALGNGTHKLPVAADVRKTIGREASSVHRVSNPAGLIRLWIDAALGALDGRVS